MAFTGELFLPLARRPWGGPPSWRGRTCRRRRLGRLRRSWTDRVTGVLDAATLTVPTTEQRGAWAAGAGRQGLHTEPFGRMLAEMQHLHRSHPGASW